MGNISRRGENSKKEPERNAADQKHCNKNEECLWWNAHSCTIIQHSFGSLTHGNQRIKNNKRNQIGKKK